MLVCCRKGKRSNKHLFLIRLFKVILHQFWVKKIFPWKFNLENGGIFTKLFMHVSSRNMFPTTRNLQIHVHVYGPRHCCGDWINFRLFCSDDCRSWSREEKSHLNNHGCFVNTPHTFLTMIIEESVCFMSCESICLAIILMWYTRIYFFFHQLKTDNLPERVQIWGHTHIICITVRENRIIYCQICCDLLLKSAFERIFNVMLLILVKIKWHIKWKYLIQKFHDICLSYYFSS